MILLCEAGYIYIIDGEIWYWSFSDEGQFQIRGRNDRRGKEECHFIVQKNICVYLCVNLEEMLKASSEIVRHKKVSHNLSMIKKQQESEIH